MGEIITNLYAWLMLKFKNIEIQTFFNLKSYRNCNSLASSNFVILLQTKHHEICSSGLIDARVVIRSLINHLQEGNTIRREKAFGTSGLSPDSKWGQHQKTLAEGTSTDCALNDHTLLWPHPLYCKEVSILLYLYAMEYNKRGDVCMINRNVMDSK